MKRLLSIAMMVSFLCSVGFAQGVAAKRQAAEQAAQTWLQIVDRGEYSQSWQEAASIFKSKVSKADWQKALEQNRTPLGAASHRTLAEAVYMTDVPNAPKGEYVVIQYKTEFANGTFIETVTPMLGKDGQWRVSGYFIKPALL